MRLTERHAKILDREWGTGGLFAHLVHHARIRADEDWFVGLTDYEARATRMKMWEVTWMPGLLQTPEYARAALSVGLVDDLEDAFEKRMARQAAVFGRPKPPHLWVLLSWAVLEQPVGGAAVMRGQLARLLEASDLPHVSVRVVEREAGEHVGLDGSVWLLTVDDRDIAHADGPHGGTLMRDPAEVQSICTRFDRIGDIACPVGPSRTLIERAMESYR
jgi:hypothetical protein